jgi:hypothetical protein
VDPALLPKFPTQVNGLAKGSRQQSLQVFAQCIACMPTSSLTFLDLRQCGIDCVGAEYIAKHLVRNTVLQTLVLHEMPLPIQLVSSIPLPRLSDR